MPLRLFCRAPRISMKESEEGRFFLFVWSPCLACPRLRAAGGLHGEKWGFVKIRLSLSWTNPANSSPNLGMMGRVSEVISSVERLLLSSTMEALRFPLLCALGRNFRHLWGRLTYEGWLPKDQKSWKGLLFRLPVAISLSYSAIGMFSPASVVLLIAFIFSILTLLLSFFAGEDRNFSVGGVVCVVFLSSWGFATGRCGMIRIHGRTSDLIDA